MTSSAIRHSWQRERSPACCETDGLALFTQYDPHGFFIALENLGYLILSAAFLFVGAAFGRANRLERSIPMDLYHICSSC
jgi:hypothetical protein